MAAFDYSKLKIGSIPRILARFGQTMTLRLVSTTPTVSKPWEVASTGTDILVKGVDLDYETRKDGLVLEEQALIVTGDRQIFIGATDVPRDPKPTDKIVIGVVVYDIIRVPLILKPSGIPVLYGLHCRE